jgi:hypothetical protein
VEASQSHEMLVHCSLSAGCMHFTIQFKAPGHHQANDISSSFCVHAAKLFPTRLPLCCLILSRHELDVSAPSRYQLGCIQVISFRSTLYLCEVERRQTCTQCTHEADSIGRKGRFSVLSLPMGLVEMLTGQGDRTLRPEFSDS